MFTAAVPAIGLLKLMMTLVIRCRAVRRARLETIGPAVLAAVAPAPWQWPPSGSGSGSERGRSRGRGRGRGRSRRGGRRRRCVRPGRHVSGGARRWRTWSGRGPCRPSRWLCRPCWAWLWVSPRWPPSRKAKWLSWTWEHAHALASMLRVARAAVDGALIVTGTTGRTPVRLSVAVGKPRGPPLGLASVIVAVRVPENASEAFERDGECRRRLASGEIQGPGGGHVVAARPGCHVLRGVIDRSGGIERAVANDGDDHLAAPGTRIEPPGGEVDLARRGERSRGRVDVARVVGVAWPRARRRCRNRGSGCRG